MSASSFPSTVMANVISSLAGAIVLSLLPGYERGRVLFPSMAGSLRELGRIFKGLNGFSVFQRFCG